VLIELFLLCITAKALRAIIGLTDGETDRILIIRSRLHSMQCGKNYRFTKTANL